MAAPCFILWMSTYPRTTPLHRGVELGYLTMLQVLTALTLWRAGRRGDYVERFRQSLRWMASAWAITFLATAAIPLAAAIQKNPSTLGLVDVAYLSTYFLTFIGLAKLPRAGAPLPSPWRILLDGATFVVGVGAPLLVFAIRPALASGLSVDSILGAAYPAMAFLGMMALNSVLLRCTPHPNRVAFYFLLVGIGVSWSADLIFSLQINRGAAFAGIRYWINICNAASLVLSLYGAWRILADPLPASPPRPVRFSPIPMITIVLVSLWLVRLLGTGLDGPTVQRVLVGVLLLVFVLLLRETLAFRDSMRQATEEATLELRARFEALVRHSSDLILVIDRNRVVSFASPASRQVLGLTADGLVGRSLKEFLHPDDATATSAFLDHLALQPGTPLSHPCRMRHADGHWRALEISGSNLLEDPAVQGFVLNARDITERHKLEDQLREAQKMEAVGRLAGGVAHDFNNLLGAIMGNLGLAEASLPEGHPAHKDLARIQGAATRGAALTGRLLAFCRRELPESKVVNPEALIHGLAPLLTGLLGEHIQLRLEITPKVGAITVDPNELEQALLNMAANARDAMPDGGDLVIRLLEDTAGGGQLTPYLTADSEDNVTIEMADTGQGMDEATQQHLFEPFFTTKGRGRGTGLGLASVYGMVKASQGGIEVGSTPGQGTTIRLTFPRTQAAPERQGSGPSETLEAGTETILLVEDEPAVRETTRRILEANGYQVITASDAQDARLHLQGHSGRVQLLLTDVIMPGQSGPRLAAELVREYPDLRVLYISGYTANELGPHGLARPDAPLLRKPFTVDQLNRKLREVLSGPPGQV